MSTMLNKRWDVIRILFAKTQQGKIEWTTGPTPEMVYANIGGLGISLQPMVSDFIVSFYDEDGALTESMTDVDFTSQGFENCYPIMQNLYEIARAHATGSEKVIDSLLDILNNI